jgi:uncharacterized membrane protein
MGRKFILYLDITLLVLLSIISLFHKSLILSIVFLFFAPGYLLVNLLFPDVWKPGYGLRVVMSVGVSTVVVGLLGLLHGYFIGDRFPILATIAIFNGVLGIIVISRRYPFGKPDSMEILIFPQIKAGFWQIVKIFSILIVIILFAYFLWIEGSQQSEFTEFYIVGDEGLTADYPSEVVVDTPFQVTVGLVNHEEKNITYAIFAIVEDEPVGVLYPFEVSSGERREDDLYITLSRVGEDQKIDIILGADDFEYPYRKLALWVNVVE